MPPNRFAHAGLIPVGFQKSTLSNSTAVAVNSTCRGGTVLDIGVETNHARYRMDGTDPTLTTGVIIPKDLAPFRFSGYNGTSQLKFQRSTGSATISIMAYREGPAR